MSLTYDSAFSHSRAALTVAMTFGSTSKPAAFILRASAFLEKTLSAAGTTEINAGRVAWRPAFLILATRAAPSALGILRVSSAWATHSFSEAAADPGRQMLPSLMGTAELAGVNFFFKASSLAESTLLMAGDAANFAAAAPDPPSVTQLVLETPENTTCFRTPRYSVMAESGMARRPSTPFWANSAASGALTFLSTRSRNLSARGEMSVMELKTG
mmetsp:Transcript_46723/g.91227  ORF Transcript_46723/g.91227 Transcript_46723/m.91227 type:complete len:215 (-) Transcript_46723:411-1055(-)